MELADLIKLVAIYFDNNKVPTDFKINNVDISLAALNQVRMSAELTNDFQFTRKLMSLEIDGVTGGSLDDAVEYGTSDNFVIRSIVDVGHFDQYGNLIPLEWTTTRDSLSRQRADTPYGTPRYPTDAQATSPPPGQARITFTGNRVFAWPKIQNATLSLGIEAYTFTPEWEDNDPDEDAGTLVWLNQGAMYLQWATIVHLNHLYKHFVFRQEGNLPPPQQLVAEALASLQNWDSFRFESRRHTR